MMTRTVDNVLLTNVLVKKFYGTESYFLDYGGGYGIFTRMMRVLGYDWAGYDKFAKNLAAQRFEYDEKRKVGCLVRLNYLNTLTSLWRKSAICFSYLITFCFDTVYDRDLAYKELDE